jgi:hypothetical protein
MLEEEWSRRDGRDGREKWNMEDRERLEIEVVSWKVK